MVISLNPKECYLFSQEGVQDSPSAPVVKLYVLLCSNLKEMVVCLLFGAACQSPTVTTRHSCLVKTVQLAQHKDLKQEGTASLDDS